MITISTNYTVTATDDIIVVQNTTNEITITLPTNIVQHGGLKTIEIINKSRYGVTVTNVNGGNIYIRPNIKAIVNSDGYAWYNIGMEYSEYVDVKKIDISNSYVSKFSASNAIPVSLDNGKLDISWFPSINADNADNADKVDGFHAQHFAFPDTIPVAGLDGKLDISWFPANIGSGSGSGSGTLVIPTIYNLGTRTVAFNFDVTNSAVQKVTLGSSLAFGIVNPPDTTKAYTITLLIYVSTNGNVWTGLNGTNVYVGTGVNLTTLLTSTTTQYDMLEFTWLTNKWVLTNAIFGVPV